MAWCRFFFPKIVTADIDPDDPAVNDNIQYAKCLRGKVLKDVNGWVLCEHLPTPDSECWQEGGKVIMPQRARSRSSS